MLDTDQVCRALPGRKAPAPELESYMASLGTEFDSQNCGGKLIHPRVVLQLRGVLRMDKITYGCLMFTSADLMQQAGVPSLMLAIAGQWKLFNRKTTTVWIGWLLKYQVKWLPNW